MMVPRAISFVAYLILTPVDSLTTWVRDSDQALPTYFRDRDALNHEINVLRQQVAEKSTDGLTLQKLLQENSLLNGLLGGAQGERVGATVIARPPELPYDLMQIDQGSERGIQEGAPVFLGHDQLVGVVAYTTKTTAFVELLTSPGFTSTVYIYGPDIFTEAEGYGGGIMRVNVPQGIDLSPGNVVIVPALDSGIYGTISHVQTSPTQPEQYGYVVPTIPLQSIYKVAVGGRPVEAVDFEVVKEVVEQNRVGSLEFDIPADLLITPTSTATTSLSTPEEGVTDETEE